MLIKGAAMILSQYHDAGLCPSVDVDILVPDTEILAAVRSLRGAGFSATGRYEGDLPERFIRIGFSHPFRSPQGNELDLHWHMLYFRSFNGADKSIWRNAVRREFTGVPVFLPSPTDMLLHTCLHGLYWSDTSNLRWVADAARLVQNAAIDWVRLAGCAEWPGAALPLRLSLEYLREDMEIPDSSGDPGGYSLGARDPWGSLGCNDVCGGRKSALEHAQPLVPAFPFQPRPSGWIIHPAGGPAGLPGCLLGTALRLVCADGGSAKNPAPVSTAAGRGARIPRSGPAQAQRLIFRFRHRCNAPVPPRSTECNPAGETLCYTGFPASGSHGAMQNLRLK